MALYRVQDAGRCLDHYRLKQSAIEDEQERGPYGHNPNVEQYLQRHRCAADVHILPTHNPAFKQSDANYYRSGRV